MTTARTFTALALAGTLAFGAAACGSSDSDSASPSAETGTSASTSAGGAAAGGDLSGSIAGAGASSQAAAQEAWTAGFQQANSGATISYDPVGSGGGREQFVSGGVAFAGSDSALADDDRLDGRYLEVNQGILSLLALQAPVATDLRVTAALLHVIKHVERMGDQCVNIAKLIPLAGHEPPVRQEIIDKLLEMGQYARSEALQCRMAFVERDVALARDLVRQDRDINRLNREIFNMALSVGDDPDTREWAMHMVLVARALERIGDNAVDIGEQTAFVVTGLFREFSDASNGVLGA
jgi:phosphate transport system protein